MFGKKASQTQRNTSNGSENETTPISAQERNHRYQTAASVYEDCRDERSYCFDEFLHQAIPYAIFFAVGAALTQLAFATILGDMRILESLSQEALPAITEAIAGGNPSEVFEMLLYCLVLASFAILPLAIPFGVIPIYAAFRKVGLTIWGNATFMVMFLLLVFFLAIILGIPALLYKTIRVLYSLIMLIKSCVSCAKAKGEMKAYC